MKKCTGSHLLIVALAVWLVAPFQKSRAQDTFSGTGTATMGSDMTPSSTKELAFEYARKAALEQFGTHVVSRHSVSEVESSSKVRQVSETRIGALATGEARLVPGSKEINREVTEHAIVYHVRAEFEIDATKFRETLEAYASEGQRSERLRDAVEGVIDVQERLSSLKTQGEEVEDVSSLLGKADRAYAAVKGAAHDINGSSLVEEMTTNKRENKNALLRYIETVKEYGHPHNLLNLRVVEKNIIDYGSSAKLEYEVEYTKSRNAEIVSSKCRTTKQVWADEGRTRWMKPIFEDQLDDFIIEVPITLYLIDDGGRIIAFVNDPSELTIDYGSCDPVELPSDGLYDDDGAVSWEAKVPKKQLQRAQEIGVLISSERYKIKLNSFIQSGHDPSGEGVPVDRMYVAPGKGVSVPSIQYSRAEFLELVNSYSSKLK
jgi:hypothetical protein